MIALDTKWKILRASVLALQLLTFTLVVATFPDGLRLPIALFSGLAILLGAGSLIKLDVLWARLALVVWAASFTVSLAVQLAFGSILLALPQLLLTYVMILFSVESLALVLQHSSAHSREMYALQASQAVPVIQKSQEHLLRKFTRLGLLFGACYLLALGAVFAGGFFASLSTFVSDISIYVVAVSVALALLLVLREE